MNRISEREHRAADQQTRDAAEQRIQKMASDGKSGSSIQQILRRRLDDIAHAIRHRNVDLLMTYYASDVDVFDVRPPLSVHGEAGYRENFEKWLGSFEGPLGFELHGVRIVPGEGAAFSHYLALVTGPRPQGRTSGYWVRGTTCFERRDGEWLVSHEHISMPATM